MKEQLISFETAKLAKEKGFEWVNFLKPNIPLVYPTTNQYDCYNDSGQLIHPKLYNKSNPHYPAPNQSLLQKWLREIKYLSVLVYMDSELDHYYVIYPIDERCTYKGKIVISKSIYSNDYERCLEAGLQEALKLI